MRTFKQGNWRKDTCLICKTKKAGEVVLIGIGGTQEGRNIQAKQVHLACLDLIYQPQLGMIIQKVK